MYFNLELEEIIGENENSKYLYDTLTDDYYNYISSYNCNVNYIIDDLEEYEKNANDIL